MDADVLGAVGGDAGHRRAGTADAGRPARSAVVTVVASRPWAAARATTIGAVGRAEQLLEPVARQRRRLREEREDPATVVVDDDDAQVGVRAPASAVSAPASWTKAMSPTRATVGAPAAARRRAPSTRRRRCRWRRGWRGRGRRRPPNHSRSRTGIDEATTSSASSGRARATRRATAGSVSGASGPSTASIAASAVVVGVDPAPPPARIADAGRGVGRAGPAPTGRAWRRRVWSGSIDAGTADLHERGARPGDPLGQHLATRPAGRRARSRPGAARPPRRSWRSKRVEGDDRPVDVAQPRRRVGEQRPTGRLDEARDVASRGAPPPASTTPRPCRERGDDVVGALRRSPATPARARPDGAAAADLARRRAARGTAG